MPCANMAARPGIVPVDPQADPCCGWQWRDKAGLVKSPGTSLPPAYSGLPGVQRSLVAIRWRRALLEERLRSCGRGECLPARIVTAESAYEKLSGWNLFSKAVASQMRSACHHRLALIAQFFNWYD